MNAVYRTMLLDHLAVAERQVLRDTGHVARQSALVAELERSGLDSRWASRVLNSFRRAQSHDVVERDRLLALLSDR